MPYLKAKVIASSINPNLWAVVLQRNENAVCLLANVRECVLCVGGGFPVASLDENQCSFEDWLEGEGGSANDLVLVSISIDYVSTWITFMVHG